MRFRIRTLLILTLLVGAAFGVVAIGDFLWTRHCKRLEPSLFAFVIQSELDQVQKEIAARETSSLGGGPLARDSPDQIYLAAGGPTDQGNWVAPSKKLLAEIGIESVRSVNELDGNNPVYLLSNVRWIDWSTVSLDMEQFQGKTHSAIRNMKLRWDGDGWSLTEPGEYWEYEPKGESDPFSTSNSGQPF